MNLARVFTLSASFAVLSFTGLAMAFVVANYWPETEPYAPLGNYNTPQPLEEHLVPVGGSIHVSVRKCNLSNETVRVNGEMHWRRLDDGHEMVVAGLLGSREFGPGCVVRSMENQLPPEVGPGLWILEGTDSAFRGKQRQDVTWRTEEFRVVQLRSG